MIILLFRVLLGLQRLPWFVNFSCKSEFCRNCIGQTGRLASSPGQLQL